MKRLPTDREILEVIYSRYYSTFVSFSKEKKERRVKIYVPVDLQAIADHLRVDGDIVFGRLYYYLEDKYGYKRDDGTHVHFFAFELGDDRHCVNFPLLASVLASLQIEHSRFRWTTAISIVSIFTALAALGVSAVSNL